MTDTAVQLRAAADLIRARAARAANNLDGDTLCCWEWERHGGPETIIGVRQFADGTTDHEVVAVPTQAGLSEHITMWDPTNAVAVAELLEMIANPAQQVPAVVYWKALSLAKLLNADGDHSAADEAAT